MAGKEGLMPAAPHQKRSIKLSILAPFPAILITAIFALNGAQNAYNAQHAIIHQAEENALNGVSTIIHQLTENQAHQAAAMAEMLAVQPAIQQHLRLGQRDELKSELDTIYHRLNASYGVEGMQFNILPGLVFLRMHAPTHFGDDVTGRQMVMLVLKGGEAQSGVEVGSSGAKIRGVVQVKDAQGVAGAVEVHVGYEPVLQGVAAMTGYELAAYVKQQGSPAADARLVEGYREIATTNRDTILSILSPGALDGVNDTLLSRQDVGGTRFGVMRMPLVDFGGNNIGVLVATQNFMAYQQAENTALREAMVSAILQIVAISGVVLLTFNGLLLRPIRRLTLELQEGEPIDAILAKRQDELGDLVRAVKNISSEGSS